MVLRAVEKKLGLPSLKEVAQTLENVPEEKKLRLIKQVLDSAAKVKGSPEELQMVLDLIRLIISADIEQLTAVKDITANLVKLAKLLPKEGLSQLPLKEIVEELKSSQ